MSEHPNHDRPASGAKPPRQRPPEGRNESLMAQFNRMIARIASLETKIDTGLKPLATKEDVSKTNLRVVATTIVGMISITIAVFAIMRYLDPN